MPSRRTAALVAVVGLFICILMRLVWLQIRPHPPILDSPTVQLLLAASTDFSRVCMPRLSEVEDAPAASTGARRFGGVPRWLYPVSSGEAILFDEICKPTDEWDISRFLRWQQWILVVVILCWTLAVRVVSGSWLLAILNAALLLSRGSLFRTVGAVNHSLLVMLWLSVGNLCFLHFLRTASPVSWSGAALTFLTGVFVDKSLLALGIAWLLTLVVTPLLWLGTGRKRRTSRTYDQAGGGIFRVMNRPFAEWLLERGRLWKQAASWFGLVLIAAATLVGWYKVQSREYWVEDYLWQMLTTMTDSHTSHETLWTWTRAALGELDAYALSALAVMAAVCVWTPPAKPAYVRDSFRFALLFCVTLSVGSYLANVSDLWYLGAIGQKSGLAVEVGRLYDKKMYLPLWLDPLILSFGLSGAFLYLSFALKNVSGVMKNGPSAGGARL